MSRLRGGPELRARLKAIQLAFRPIGRKWAKTAVEVGRPMVPVGKRPHPGPKLRESLKVKRATQRKATVGAWYTAYFVDAGTHYPKVKRRGNRDRKAVPMSIFRKRGMRTRPRPFRTRMALEALRREPMAQTIIELWNRAGR